MRRESPPEGRSPSSAGRPGPRGDRVRRFGAGATRGAVVTAVTLAGVLAHDVHASAAVAAAPESAQAPPLPVGLLTALAEPTAVTAGTPAVATDPRSRARESALSRLEVVAHRGGTGWGPESTLATFTHAIEAGADAIEFDVRFTKDAVPVVFHDVTLDRTTDCTGPIAEITLRKLKECDAGSWYDANPLPGEEVPTLDEALDLLADTGTKAYLHIKMANRTQAELIMKVVDSYDLNYTSGPRNPTTFIADSDSILGNMKAAGAKRFGLVFSNLRGWDSPYDVLLPYKTPVTKELVAKAQRGGHDVVPVQREQLTINALADLELDGYMVNDLERLLIAMNRMEPDRDDREAGRADDRTDDPDRSGDGRDGRDGADGRAGRDGKDGDDG